MLQRVFKSCKLSVVNSRMFWAFVWSGATRAPLSRTAPLLAGTLPLEDGLELQPLARHLDALPGHRAAHEPEDTVPARLRTYA